jgi:hypothetical protein
MVDPWSEYPIQKLCQIFKPTFMTNFVFSEIFKYFFKIYFTTV